MKKYNKNAIFGFFMVFPLLFQILQLSFSVYAADINNKTGFSVPDIIKDSNFDTSDFVSRDINSEKDLYTFVFKNENGTNTKISYSHPVKYVKDDTVVDISLALVKNKRGEYESTNHPINTSFSKVLADGISLNYNDLDVLLYSEVSAKAKQIDYNAVEYDDNSGISYKYSLTYTGIKEDIILHHPVEKYEFDFTVITNGFRLTDENGIISIIDDYGNKKAHFSDILVFSGDNNLCSTGKILYNEIEERFKYNLSVCIDKEIIDNEELYPLTIDPSLETDTVSSIGVFEDLTINSNDQVPAGTSGSLFVGKRDTYGKSRVLMKFPNIDFSDVGRASDIIDAKVYIRDLMCESASMDVYCYRFTGNNWSENDPTSNWNNVAPNQYYNQPLDMLSVSYNNGLSNDPVHYYGFNITAAVQIWKQSSVHKNKGIIFKASDDVETGNTYISKTFGSYNRNSNNPFIVITYTTSANVHFSELPQRLLINEAYSIQVNPDYAFSSAVNYNYFVMNSNNAVVNNAEFSQSGRCIFAGREPCNCNLYCGLFVQDYNIDIFSIPLRITLRDDIYYIRNKETERHISALNNSFVEGNTLCQWTFNPSVQNWRIDYHIVSSTDGYYTIMANTSGVPYYFGINGTGGLILTSNTVLNETRWRITMVDGERYKISPYNNNSNALAVYGNGSSNSNGVAIELASYVYNSNYSDEWTLCSKKSVSFVSGHDDEDLSLYFNRMDDSFDSIGISNNYLSTLWLDYNMTPEEVIDRMRYSKAVFVCAHGSAGSVTIHDEHLMNADIYNKYLDDNNAFDLCDLVVYLSCLTASGGVDANNLCKVTKNAGVTTVIGFEESIPMTVGDFWMEKFVDFLVYYWGDATKTYINIMDLAMEATEDQYENYMEYDYGDIHLVMDSDLLFGVQSLPGINDWN